MTPQGYKTVSLSRTVPVCHKGFMILWRIVAHMSAQHNVYYSEDEHDLKDFVERYEDVFGSRSELIKKAIKHYRNDRKDVLETMLEDEDDESLT